MTAKDKLKKEIGDCLQCTLPLIGYLNGEDKCIKEVGDKIFFNLRYQSWYSRALKILEFSGKDRLQEFKSYYEVNHKRKTIGYGEYYIQDFLMGLIPTDISGFDPKKITLQNIINQYSILSSIGDRIDSILADIQTHLLTELQDTELATAKDLLKVNVRSAGVIAGVVLEGYLLSVVNCHQLRISKKHPGLSDFNEVLKNNNIIDTSVWRKISYLSDIRNLCAHNKEKEPTKAEVEEMIEGVNWVTKNVF